MVVPIIAKIQGNDIELARLSATSKATLFGGGLQMQDDDEPVPCGLFFCYFTSNCADYSG